MMRLVNRYIEHHTAWDVVKLVKFLHTLGGFSITSVVLTLVEFLHTLGGFSSFSAGRVSTYTGRVFEF